MEQKNKLDSIGNINNEIREIYNGDRSDAEPQIEKYLQQLFIGYSHAERLYTVKMIATQFKSYDHEAGKSFNIESKEFSRLLFLLLGKKEFNANRSPGELTENLADSLNTIFNTINSMINVINTTLFGKNEKMETIRGIIGSNLKEVRSDETLQDYLDQIKEAFLIAHEAFQQAAQVKIKKIFDELDPKTFSSSNKGGLKIKAFRKAESFENYENKYQVCKDWFVSGRFNKEFLREFENTCQKLYKTKRRVNQ